MTPIQIEFMTFQREAALMLVLQVKCVSNVWCQATITMDLYISLFRCEIEIYHWNCVFLFEKEEEELIVENECQNGFPSENGGYTDGLSM